MLLKGPETPRAEDGKELLPFLGRGNRGVLTAIAVYLATIALVSLVPVSTGPAVDVIVN